ncbi:MAG: hypothetical protein R2568_11510 [Candidatus Scalindua sp.]|jgi:DNA-directed RNA polymerase subunit K/omega|nr:hypothetical protein [Candidatus Scalindua sp.]MDV5167353.1 hypothetical protein [Candidatus Scalindua sp.]
MHVSGMGQWTAAVRESFAAITIDRQSEQEIVKEVNTSPIQNRYTDTVQISDRALELYMNADSGTNTNEKLDTDQRLEEVPNANLQEKQQPALARAVSLINAFA